MFPKEKKTKKGKKKKRRKKRAEIENYVFLGFSGDLKHAHRKKERASLQLCLHIRMHPITTAATKLSFYLFIYIMMKKKLRIEQEEPNFQYS